VVIELDATQIAVGRVPVCDAHVQMATWPEWMFDEMREEAFPLGVDG
jgi:metal-sulfur cluster biosynthetic enzyme